MEARTPHRYPFEEMDGLDFHPGFAVLREEGSLARVRLPYGGDAWLATRYDVVKFVLGDERFSLGATHGRDVPRDAPRIESEPNLMTMDPPEHTRLRRLFAKALTARHVERLRPRARQIADELLDGMAAAGPPADVMEHLALPFPATVMCELLGVPASDRERLRTLADAGMALTAFTEAEIVHARDELKATIIEQIRLRRQTPKDDLLGTLVQARDQGDALTEDELVMIGWMLLAADKTNTDQLGNFVYTLLARPELWNRLRTTPKLLPSAVEELLRYTPLGAGAGFARIAICDVQVGDVLVQKGEAVLVKMSAGNRDGRVFERAEELDLARAPNPHIAFGYGAHHCPGAQLTRMEMQVALGALLARFPDLTIAVPLDQLRWKHGRRERSLDALPVTWTSHSPPR